VHPCHRAEPAPGTGCGPSEVLAGDGAGDAEGLVRPLLVRGAAAMLQTIQTKLVVLDPAVEAGVTGTTQQVLLKLGVVGGLVQGVGPMVLRQRLRGAVALRADQPESAFELRDLRPGGLLRVACAAGATLRSVAPVGVRVRQ
jgi:hypothetical protein